MKNKKQKQIFSLEFKKKKNVINLINFIKTRLIYSCMD